MGDYEKSAPWSESSVKGCKRFLDKVWNLFDSVKPGTGYSAALEGVFNRTVKKVTEDIEAMKFNTALAALMTLVNEINAAGSINSFEYGVLLRLLAPFAPHICEELWEMLGGDTMVCFAEWPEFDEEKCKEATVEIAVQLNGKIKARINIDASLDAAGAIAAAKAAPEVAALLSGMQVIKEFYATGKLVNIVVKPL